MDFITDIKGPLLERFSPEQVNDIVDIITLALVRYDVEPKSTALVEYKAEDRQRKADLREYRKQHPKPYYLN